MTFYPDKMEFFFRIIRLVFWPKGTFCPGFGQYKTAVNQYFRPTTSYSTPTPLFILSLSKSTRVGNNMKEITL